MYFLGVTYIILILETLLPGEFYYLHFINEETDSGDEYFEPRL